MRNRLPLNLLQIQFSARFSVYILVSILFFSVTINFRQETVAAIPEDEAHVWNQTHVHLMEMELVKTIDFTSPESIQGWVPQSMSTLAWKDGAMVVDSTGEDPYLRAPGTLTPEGNTKPQELFVRLTMRGSKSSSVAIYWTDQEKPHFSQERSVTTNAQLNPKEWGTVELRLKAPFPIQAWRLDPACRDGRFEVQKIEVFRVKNDGPQLEVLPVESVRNPGANGEKVGTFPTTSQTVQVRITNPKEEAATFMVNGKSEHFEAGESRIFSQNSHPELPVETFVFEVSHPDYPPIRRELELVHDTDISSWNIVKGKDVDFALAPDLSVMFLCRNGKKIAAFTQLHRLDPGLSQHTLNFQNHVLKFELSSGDALPVIHIPGEIQFAVIPGVEMLEKGEWSSSRADMVIPERLRMRPDPGLLTQQWFGIVTEDGTFRIQWTNPRLQPEFATPNYFDSTPDARLSLEFPKVLNENDDKKETVMFTFTPETDEDALFFAGLDAQMAHAHRTAAGGPLGNTDQTSVPEEDLGGNRTKLFSLYREQLTNGPIHSEVGWGHCAGDRWKKAPLADIASAFWRVGGDVPDFRFQMGGAHVENPTIFFVREQADVWLQNLCGQADTVLKSRQADGSWRYTEKFAVTHFETTALGVCIRPVWTLLQAYAATGNEKYLKPALETLVYCRRFNVARGAQCWEMPLHTPDPLAAAYAIRASVLAYRITGDPQFLADAERWALEGATYIYLWDEPQMPWQFGAFIGVLGATYWELPNWIGRPVQWIGTVYAYALLEYVDILKTLESQHSSVSAARWRQLAELITLSAERQIYQNGEFAGLLPDSVDCASEMRYAWNINPSVPIALRLRLDGEQESVRFTWNESHRVASVFPVTLAEDHLTVQPPAGLPIQLVVDGKIVSVPASNGTVNVPYAQ